MELASKVFKAARKPAIVRCIEWKGDLNSTKKVLEFMGQKVRITCNKSSDAFWDYHHHCLQHGIEVTMDGGSVRACVGDIIIREDGKYFPLKPEAFEKLYERSEEV